MIFTLCFLTSQHLHNQRLCTPLIKTKTQKIKISLTAYVAQWGKKAQAKKSYKGTSNQRPTLKIFFLFIIQARGNQRQLQGLSKTALPGEEGSFVLTLRNAFFQTRRAGEEQRCAHFCGAAATKRPQFHLSDEEGLEGYS